MPKAQRVAKPLPPDAWDGIERRRDAGIHTVDINQASLEELVALHGLGRRAALVVADRAQHGPFKGIYDLLRVEGIGRKLFIRITGLQPAPTKRKDRHAVLNELLGLEPNAAPPTLVQIVERLCERLPATACVLGMDDGIPLAMHGGDPDVAARHAALLPWFFRKSRRFLKRVANEPVRCVLLPFSGDRVILAQAGEMFLAVTLGADASLDEPMRKIQPFLDELEWLFSRRAVMREEARPTA